MVLQIRDHSKSTYAPKRAEGRMKTYKGRGGGGRGKAYVRYKKIAISTGNFSPHIIMIKQVSNLLVSCLASSTHLLAGFKSMT